MNFRWVALKPSPWGEGGPAGPDEGRVCRRCPFIGCRGKVCPHQSAVGAADSFPRGGSRSAFLLLVLGLLRHPLAGGHNRGIGPEVLKEDEIDILVDLGSGDATAKAWGCDLTYDYVKINGDYRT